MLKSMLISAIFSVASVSVAMAGDTVTVNMPGGATQTVSAGAFVAGFNEVRGLPQLPSGNVGSFTITRSGPGGTTVTITSGGTSYTVSSGFITTMLLNYAGG